MRKTKEERAALRALQGLQPITAKQFFHRVFPRFLSLCVYAVCFLPVFAAVIDSLNAPMFWSLWLYGSWILELGFIVCFMEQQNVTRIRTAAWLAEMFGVILGLNALCSCLLIQPSMIPEGMALSQGLELIWFIRGALMMMTLVTLLLLTALSRIRTENLLGGRWLFLGLILLTLQSLIFANVRLLSYIAFGLFLVGFFLLMLFLTRRNKLVAGLGAGIIITVALLLALFNTQIVALIGLIYQNIIVPVITVLIYIGSLFVRLFGVDLPAREGESLLEASEENEVVNELEALNEAAEGVSPANSQLWVFIVIAALVIGVVALVLYLFSIFRKAQREEKQEVDEERRALTAAEIAELEAAETQGQRSDEAHSRQEQRIRRLMRETLKRMYGLLYPITRAHTVLEVNEVLKKAGKDDGGLSGLYGRVRYGGKELSEAEMAEAEAAYKGLRKELNGLHQ